MYPIITKSATHSSASSKIILSSVSEIKLSVIFGAYFVAFDSISESNALARLKRSKNLKNFGRAKTS